MTGFCLNRAACQLELPDEANVVVATVYWDPTHKCHRIATELPEGETLPDLNRLVCIDKDTGARQSPRNSITSRKAKVAEALARRLPASSAPPMNRKGLPRRRANTTGAGRTDWQDTADKAADTTQRQDAPNETIRHG